MGAIAEVVFVLVVDAVFVGVIVIGSAALLEAVVLVVVVDPVVVEVFVTIGDAVPVLIGVRRVRGEDVNFIPVIDSVCVRVFPVRKGLVAELADVPKPVPVWIAKRICVVGIEVVGDLPA